MFVGTKFPGMAASLQITWQFPYFINLYCKQKEPWILKQEKQETLNAEQAFQAEIHQTLHIN